MTSNEIRDTPDVDAPSLYSFDLSTPQGRFDFLWHLSVAGEEGLLAATAHVWSSLAPPAVMRTTKMAAAAKVKGWGKVGLLNVLARFLVDFEMETDPPALPLREDFESSDVWQEEVWCHFERGEQAMTAVIERYAAILNGGALASPTPTEILL